MDLTETEKNDLLLAKRCRPFLAWFMVKTKEGQSELFHDKRAAHRFAKNNAPATIYAAQ